MAAATLDASPPRRAPSEREQVVGCELLRHFMREAGYRHLAIAAMKAAIVIFCWEHVDRRLLLAWFGAGIALIGLRVWVERRYGHPDAFKTLEAQAAFVKAMRPVYAMHAAVWGMSTLFYFNQLPASNQYACGLIMACVAALPLRSAALVPALMRIYMDTLFMVITACLAVASLTSWVGGAGSVAASGPDWVSSYLFLAVPAFQWWLLSSVGQRVHANQRGQYELQYDLARQERDALALAEGRIRFLTAAAHDLRQPTMALSIYADQLLERPEDHLMLAPKIARASVAVNHLFDSLFDLANLDSGKVKLRIESVQLAEVLHDLRDQFEGVARARSIGLHVRSADVVILTDAVRLRRMVGNVISNAIKYSEPDTKVRVVARKTRGMLHIEVSDEGFGIPEADLEKVFDEFYRVERPDRGAEDGVGLGLSIVTRLARLLGCEIRLRSVVGQGTRFTFVIAQKVIERGGPQTSFGVG